MRGRSRRWMRDAQDRSEGRSLGETDAQLWVSCAYDNDATSTTSAGDAGSRVFVESKYGPTTLASPYHEMATRVGWTWTANHLNEASQPLQVTGFPSVTIFMTYTGEIRAVLSLYLVLPHTCRVTDLFFIIEKNIFLCSVTSIMNFQNLTLVSNMYLYTIGSLNSRQLYFENTIT
jgi:hypothetical protein